MLASLMRSAVRPLLCLPEDTAQSIGGDRNTLITDRPSPSRLAHEDCASSATAALSLSIGTLHV